MELQLVEFYAAKMLKKHGFSEMCEWAYDARNAKLIFHKKKENHNKDHNKISAPTQALVCKWLRDRHNIFISIMFELDTWELYIDNGINKGSFSPEEASYDSFEEAEKVGIQQGIKILNLKLQKL